jgi:2'-5' RNA ligase
MESIHEYGCVMINLNIKNWDEILNMISKEDLYLPENEIYGFEKNPHLTLLYGLHKEVTTENVIEVLNQFNTKDIKIEINGIGSFENEEYDVLKMNVLKNNLLNNIHYKLKELPNSDKYDEYNPHITIAYLKSGSSKKYIDTKFKIEIDNNQEIVYSKDGKINKI